MGQWNALHFAPAQNPPPPAFLAFCQEDQPISEGMSCLVPVWGELNPLCVCNGLF